MILTVMVAVSNVGGCLQPGFDQPAGLRQDRGGRQDLVRFPALVRGEPGVGPGWWIGALPACGERAGNCMDSSSTCMPLPPCLVIWTYGPDLCLLLDDWDPFVDSFRLVWSRGFGLDSVPAALFWSLAFRPALLWSFHSASVRLSPGRPAVLLSCRPAVLLSC